MLGSAPPPRQLNSTGPSPTQLWFGGLPDRLNMLAPSLGAGQTSGSNAELVANVSPIVAANFANQFSAVGCSFGAATAAPDGTTSNSQSIVEDTSTGVHGVNACIYRATPQSAPYGTLRFSVFLKGNGRRAVLQCVTDQGVFSDGVRAVFDLAGGQVAIPTATFFTNTPQVMATYTAVGQEIVPFGNGWYRCSMDFTFRPFSLWMVCLVYLDNGTGTGALSMSYTGNGSSGVFAWKTNLNPVPAYKLNNVTFFDDFNDLSTIDVNNTKAPGFNWYVNNNWTNWIAGNPVTNPAWLSVSNSVLTIAAQNRGGTTINLMSTVETTPGNFIGQTWTIPMLLEFRVSWAWQTRGWQFFTSLWCISQAWISANAAGGAPLQRPAKEQDWIEIAQQFFNNEPQNNMHFINGNVSIGVTSGEALTLAAPIYNPGQVYAPGVIVTSGGNIYQSNASVPINTTPPAAQWDLKTYPTTTTSFPNVPFDLSVLHTWSFLIIPWYGATAGPNSPTAVGAMYVYIDGLCAGLLMSYGPSYADVGQGIQQLADGAAMPIIIGADAAQPGPGVPISLDFVKITQ